MDDEDVQWLKSGEYMLTAMIMYTAVALTTAPQPTVDNAESEMGGGVSGPGGGLSGQQGVIFVGTGIDRDNDDTVSEMEHVAQFNSTPSDNSAPGAITGGPSLVYSYAPAGEKRWEVGYTLVTVPPNEVWVRKCEMILSDNSENVLRTDFLEIFEKLIYVSGPVTGGGGGGGN